MDHERDARTAFEEVHLVPQAVLAEHVAVICGDDGHGVIGQAKCIQGVENLPGPLVHIGAVAVVGATCPANVVLGDRRVGHVRNMGQPLRMGVGRR